jgi:CRP-like cAMP-binding protein
MKQNLLSFSPFRVLKDADFEWLELIGQKKNYSSGTVLTGENKSAPYLYICLSGSLAVTVSPLEASKEELITFSPGEIIGENLLLDQQAATVMVKEPAELLVLPQEQLTKRLAQNSEFAARFYHLLSICLSERLRKLTKLMANRNLKEGEPLRKVLVVFATLNDSDIAWMVANGVSEKAALGNTLIQQEQPVPAVYLLLEGMLGIYVSIPQNGSVVEKEVAQRVKGEIFGEISFVDGGVASASVKSLENAWVLALPQKMLAAKFQEDYGFAQRFYRSLALILSNRCLDLLTRGSLANGSQSSMGMLSEDIEVEDELDFDLLEGTAIAGTRFDWIIQQLRR